MSTYIFRAIAPLFCLLLLTKLHAAPFGPTTGDLYSSCKSDTQMDIAYCIGYLKAYRDWYEAAKDQLVGEQQRYCEPENINFKDIQQSFVDYVKTHPELQSEPRLIGVTRALNGTWPCPDNPLAIIQTMLRLLGYDIEGTTGKLDSKTLAAIESYQRKHNIPPGKLSTQALLENIFQYVRSKNFILMEKQ